MTGSEIVFRVRTAVQLASSTSTSTSTELSPAKRTGVSFSTALVASAPLPKQQTIVKQSSSKRSANEPSTDRTKQATLARLQTHELQKSEYAIETSEQTAQIDGLMKR